jgi:predicted RND superfamily exporter protein
VASPRTTSAAPGPSMIGRLILSRPGAVVLIAVIMAMTGGWLAGTRLVLDADTNHLIAPERPFMAGFEAWLAEFGDLERIAVVVDASTTEAATDVVHEIVRRLEDRTDLPEIHGWISAGDRWRLAPWAMPEPELQSLIDAADGLALLAGDATTPAILDAGVERLRRLTEPTALTLSDDARRDLGASGLVLLGAIAGAAGDDPTLPANPVRLGADDGDTLLANPGGTLRFIEILPRKEFGSLAAIAEPLAAIRTVIDEVAAEHPGVEIGVTGKPVLQADELATSDADMTRCAAAALAIIALIFVRTFHGWRRPLLMVVAFAIAFGWTYGAATLLVGRLNLLSIVFMLVLVGVGLDYGVHVVTRWQACRSSGASLERSVQETIATAGRGNVFGAATSAGVFLLALATEFGGLRELGVIAGVGLLFCVIAMNVVLPALLVMTERGGVEPAASNPPRSRRPAPARPRHPAVATVILVIAALGSITLGVVVARDARFEDNLLELQADGLDSVDWERRVLADSTSASWFAASTRDSIDEVQTLVAAAATRPEIGTIRSVLDLVPPPTPARAELLAAFASRTSPANVDSESKTETGTGTVVTADSLHAAARVTARLATLARGADADAAADLDAVAVRLASIAETAAREPEDTTRRLDAARHRAGQAVRDLRIGAESDLRDALPPAVRDRLMSPNGRFMVSLVPAEDIWSPEPMARFVAAIRAIDPDVTGVPITQYESLRDMRRSFLDMATLATVLVAGLVWLDFRRVRRTLVVMTVLAVGLLWTIGIVTLLGVHLNVANFFAIPILIGLGVDSAIHLLHRLDETGDGVADLGATRRAVILTAVTTGIGFGSLVFARHRGLESLGVVMAVGSLCCLVSTLVLLPALVRPGRGTTDDGIADS